MLGRDPSYSPKWIRLSELKVFSCDGWGANDPEWGSPACLAVKENVIHQSLARGAILIKSDAGWPGTSSVSNWYLVGTWTRATFYVRPGPTSGPVRFLGQTRFTSDCFQSWSENKFSNTPESSWGKSRGGCQRPDPAPPRRREAAARAQQVPGMLAPHSWGPRGFLQFPLLLSLSGLLKQTKVC